MNEIITDIEKNVQITGDDVTDCAIVSFPWHFHDLTNFLLDFNPHLTNIFSWKSLKINLAQDRSRETIFHSRWEIPWDDFWNEKQIFYLKIQTEISLTFPQNYYSAWSDYFALFSCFAFHNDFDLAACQLKCREDCLVYFDNESKQSREAGPCNRRDREEWETF